MPNTVKGLIKKADREKWTHRTRSGRGGGREYALSSLPKATQKALLEKQAIAEFQAEKAQVAVVPTTTPSLLVVTKDEEISDWQREQRDAREGVCRAVKALMQKGMKKPQAIQAVIGIAIKEGEGSHEYKQLLQARDERGLKNAKGEPNFPSPKTIGRWLKTDDLTAKTRQKDLQWPAWAKDFLACYQQPQKPSVDAAYTEFCRYQGNDRPSIHQVRRFLGNLPDIVREKGRMGPRELKNIMPFVRREFEDLWPNDVWSADGHTFDAEVQHPLHGRPFEQVTRAIFSL